MKASENTYEVIKRNGRKVVERYELIIKKIK